MRASCRTRYYHPGNLTPVTHTCGTVVAARQARAVALMLPWSCHMSADSFHCTIRTVQQIGHHARRTQSQPECQGMWPSTWCVERQARIVFSTASHLGRTCWDRRDQGRAGRRAGDQTACHTIGSHPRGFTRVAWSGAPPKRLAASHRRQYDTITCTLQPQHCYSRTGVEAARMPNRLSDQYAVCPPPLGTCPVSCALCTWRSKGYESINQRTTYNVCRSAASH